jgi:hypothetical protein
MTPIEITEKELEEQIDRIVEEYDKGSDQHYAIVRDGEKIAYLVPLTKIFFIVKYKNEKTRSTKTN